MVYKFTQLKKVDYRKVGLFRNFGGKCATLYLTNYSFEKEKLLIKYPYFPKLTLFVQTRFGFAMTCYTTRVGFSSCIDASTIKGTESRSR